MYTSNEMMNRWHLLKIVGRGRWGRGGEGPYRTNETLFLQPFLVAIEPWLLIHSQTAEPHLQKRSRIVFKKKSQQATLEKKKQVFRGLAFSWRHFGTILKTTSLIDGYCWHITPDDLSQTFGGLFWHHYLRLWSVVCKKNRASGLKQADPKVPDLLLPRENKVPKLN